MDAAAKFRVSCLFTKIATLRHSMEFAKTGSTDITAYASFWYSVNCKQLKDISLLKIPERLPPDFTFLFKYRKRGFASPGAELLGGLANNGMVL